MPPKVTRKGSLRAAFRARVRGVEDAKLRAAQVTASIAHQLCPVSKISAPGYQHLRDRIAIYQGARGGVKVVADKDYAIYVDRATGFFRVAVEQGRAQLRRDLRELRGRRRA
jgi:hypothetical protein